jgi:hypothetical protein
MDMAHYPRHPFGWGFSLEPPQMAVTPCPKISALGPGTLGHPLIQPPWCERLLTSWPIHKTELGVFIRPEVSHGETKVYAGV